MGAQRVPAVGEQHPGSEPHIGCLVLGHTSGQHAQAPLALGVDGGDGSGCLGVAERLGASIDDAVAVLAQQHRNEVCTTSAERLADRVDELEGQVHLLGHRAPADRDVLGDGRGPGELAGPPVGGEPGELEDDAVAGGKGGDGVVGLSVPRLDVRVGRGHVDVEGERGRGEEPDGAGDSRVEHSFDADQSAVTEGLVGVVERRQRCGVRRVLSASPGLAEATLDAARAGLGVIDEVEGQRCVTGEVGGTAQLGQGEGQAPGQPVEEARRERSGRGQVDGHHVRVPGVRR